MRIGTTALCTGQSIGFLEALNTTGVSYTWVFGDGDTSHLKQPTHVYLDSGIFDVTLICKDSSGCEQVHKRSAYIKVQATPIAEFTADKTDSNCYPLPVQFTADTNIVYYNDNDYLYSLGDFQAASNYKDPFYNYVRPGWYTVSLIVKSTNGCSDTIVKKDYIKVSGPYAEITISDDSICRGDSIVFEMINPIDVAQFGWDFGDGNVQQDTNPAIHYYYDSIGVLYPNLVMTDTAGGCAQSFEDTIYVYETAASFTFDTSSYCVPYNPGFYNYSIQAENFFWKFGDGGTTSKKHPSKIYYDPGTYLIELRAWNSVGCRDTMFQEITVFPLPNVLADPDTLICEGDPVQLFSSGGEKYSWNPSQGLNSASIPNPLASPKVSMKYEVEIIDTNMCIDTANASVLVQNRIVLVLDDISEVIGDTITLNGYGGKGVKYKWDPPLGLSCDTCPYPLLTILESGKYTLTITDSNECFENIVEFNVEVLKKYTIDVPTAFTPNGDGTNDVIFVRGWGLKELVSFKIYNRWGEMIFESNNLNIGWDGTYKGRIQEVETYVYYVEALTYEDRVLTKKGNINLIK